MDCNDIWNVGRCWEDEGQGQFWAPWYVTLVLQQKFRFLYLLTWMCYGLDFLEADNS